MPEYHTDKNEIKEFWNDGDSWKTGLEAGGDVYRLMEFISLAFTDTPQGREARNLLYSRLNEIKKDFYENEGLFFGAIKVVRGKPKVYFIARTAQEMIQLDSQTIRKQHTLKKQRATNRLLMSDKLQYLKDKNNKKLLEEQIAKR